MQKSQRCLLGGILIMNVEKRPLSSLENRALRMNLNSFLSVAASIHRTVGASAPTGGDPLLLFTEQACNDANDNGKQYGTDQYRCQILIDPGHHPDPSCSLLSVSTRCFVSFVDSRYGRKSIYSIKTRTATAATSPMICRLPVSAEPNW